MYLVLLKINSGKSLEVWHRKCYIASASYGTDIVPELASMTSVDWCGELEFTDDSHILENGVTCGPEGYLQIAIVDDGCGCNLKMYDRKVWNGFGFGDMFVADARQAVIGRHEQIVTADVAACVERWSFGSYGSG